MKTIDPRVVVQVDRMSFTTEASMAGLAPGEWPPEVMFGGQKFKMVSRPTEQGTTYRDSFGRELRIDND